MREKVSDKIKDTTEDENVFSSQDMINDARARRYQKGKLFKCDHCDFKSTSQTLSKRHQQSVHKEVIHACDQCIMRINGGSRGHSFIAKNLPNHTIFY